MAAGGLSSSVRLAAVDIGGTSVRMTAATVGPDRITIDRIVRFETPFVRLDGCIHVDVELVIDRILDFIRQYASDVEGIGVDSWSGDYGILNRDGSSPLPFSQREPRTADIVRVVDALVPVADVFEASGTHALPFSPIYQLATDSSAGRLGDAAAILLIPDLVNHRLTGRLAAEFTNASTTGLTSWRDRDWNRDLIERLGLDVELFPEVVEPGTVLGRVLPQLAAGNAVVTAVASHDTASAVVGLPTHDEQPLFISCGTWSLVGTLTDAPVLTELVAQSGFTNEAGLDGTNRLLSISGGLWLLNQCLGSWNISSTTNDPHLQELISAAAQLPPSASVFDPSDPALTKPGDMPHRLERAAGLVEGSLTPAQIVRLVFDSLVSDFARRVAALEVVTGRRFDSAHLVGGGASIDLLCELTASALGRTVFAGPSEATTIGNLLVQARTAGVIAGSAASLRAHAARLFPPKRFDPHGSRQ